MILSELLSDKEIKALEKLKKLKANDGKLLPTTVGAIGDNRLNKKSPLTFKKKKLSFGYKIN